MDSNPEPSCCEASALTTVPHYPAATSSKWNYGKSGNHAMNLTLDRLRTEPKWLNIYSNFCSAQHLGKVVTHFSAQNRFGSEMSVGFVICNSCSRSRHNISAGSMSRLWLGPFQTFILCFLDRSFVGCSWPRCLAASALLSSQSGHSSQTGVLRTLV